MLKRLLTKQGIQRSLIFMTIALIIILFKSEIYYWNLFSLNFTNFFFILYLYAKNKDIEYSIHSTPAFYFAAIFGVLNAIYYYTIGDYYNYNILAIYGLSLIIIIGSQIIGLFYIINSLLSNIVNCNGEKYKKSLKKTWIILFTLSFTISLIFFLISFPGLYSFDSMRQVEQAVGATQLNNHHPIFMTMILRWTMILGQTLGLSNLGIAVYPFIQIIVNSIIYASVSCYLIYKGVSIKYLIFFLIFIYANPLIYFYNITVWKDIQLAMTFLIFTVLNTEYIFDKKKFLNNKFKLFWYIVIMVLFSLWKGNAIYVLVLSFLIYIIVLKEYRRLNASIIIIVFVINSIITGPIYSSIGGEPGEASEALSIFLQQIGGIANDDEATITAEQMEKLGEYIDLDTLDDYNPQLSDPIKSYFNEEQFAKDKISFFKVWLDIVIHNFPQAIEATFKQTSAYYSLPNQRWLVLFGVAESEILGDEAPMRTTQKPFNENSARLLVSLRILRYIPVICALWSIGLFFWILLILLYVYNKKYSKTAMLVLVPSLMLWLTIIASPVNGEYRYAFPMILAVNYLLCYATKKEDDMKVMEKTFN